MGGNARESGRTSSSRLFALLDAFASGPPTMSLTELATKSKLPVSTAHRLLGELCEWEALERNDDGRYQIGGRLWQIGSLAPRYRTLRATAVPYMEDLYEITHENVALAVRDGKRALYLDNISGRRSSGPPRPVGHRTPLHATAVGKVMLAFSEPELLNSLLKHRLHRCTRYTITTRAKLIEEVDRTRETQVGYSIQEMVLGRTAVAAPILGINGVLIAVLTIVSRPSNDLTRLAPAVRAAAGAVSRQLTERYISAVS
ncbi:MAG: IclR family transcriptional regulator [Solirubrobacterales bacterium]